MIRRVFALATGEFGARLIGVLTFALLGRGLGVSGFGTFSFAMSCALIVGVMVDMGQNAHLGRVVARDRKASGLMFPHVVGNKLLLTLVVIPILYAGLTLAGFTSTEVTLVVLMSVWAAVLSILDSMRSIARAHEYMWLDSGVNSLESLTRLLVVAAALYFGLGAIGVGLVFILEALVSAVVFYFVLSRYVSLSGTPAERYGHRRILRESAMLGVAALAAAGFYRLDQVLVQGAAGAYENGLYGAAARLVFTATAASSIVMNAHYPVMAVAADDYTEYRRVALKALVFAGGIGAVLAVAVFVLAAPLVHILYGSEYAPAASLVRIMAGVIFLNSLSATGIYSASCLGRERWTVLIVIVLAATTVAIGLVTIPVYGATAAAWLSVLGEGVLAALLFLVSANRLVSIPRWRGQALPGVGSSSKEGSHADR